MRASDSLGKLQESQTSLLLPLGLGPALLINHVDGDDGSKQASIPAAPKQPSGIAQVTVNSLSKHSFLWTPPSHRC